MVCRKEKKIWMDGWMVGVLCPHAEIKDKSFGQLLRVLTFATYLKKVKKYEADRMAAETNDVSFLCLINTK